jgi:peptidoglycan/xylan/chitin deacetylase (PgdA/CDA1 family)
MALEPLSAAVCPTIETGAGEFRNDAFSFWKPPEHLRARLEVSTLASEVLANWYLLEQYLPQRARRPPRGMSVYYALKQGIPLWLRHGINALVIKTRRRGSFPHWPYESALIDLRQSWLEQSAPPNGEERWHIGFWPEGKACCIVLTHDVESPIGFARMERMADLEERYGFRSSWNLPLAQYPLDWQLIARLESRGFEFGAHGLSHDGKLFRSYEDFSHLAPQLEIRSREHNLRGFRSPSTLRRAEWIQLLDFDYDCSFADTDPFEPQPGGTCSVFPFFLGAMVELPYTLPQDHTMIHLLHRDPLPLWLAKVQWLASIGGMILTLIHPDYCGAPPYLRSYEELLRHLAAIQSAWRALPSQVAAWWRQRAGMQLTMADGIPRIVSDANGYASVARLNYPAAAAQKAAQ